MRPVLPDVELSVYLGAISASQLDEPRRPTAAAAAFVCGTSSSQFAYDDVIQRHRRQLYVVGRLPSTIINAPLLLSVSTVHRTSDSGFI